MKSHTSLQECSITCRQTCKLVIDNLWCRTLLCIKIVRTPCTYTTYTATFDTFDKQHYKLVSGCQLEERLEKLSHKAAKNSSFSCQYKTDKHTHAIVTCCCLRVACFCGEPALLPALQCSCLPPWSQPLLVQLVRRSWAFY